MRKIYRAGFYCKTPLLLATYPSLKDLHAQIDINAGTGTTSNANTTYPCPMQDFYEESRTPYLYRFSELNAAGMSSGSVNAIKFNVTSLATNTNSFFAIGEFTVELGTTGSLGAAIWEPVTATVSGPVNYMTVIGFNTFVFNTPFSQNGPGNLDFEICGGDPNSTTDVFRTANSVVPWTKGLGFNGVGRSRLHLINPVRDILSVCYTGSGAKFPIMLMNVNGALLMRNSFTKK